MSRSIKSILDSYLTEAYIKLCEISVTAKIVNGKTVNPSCPDTGQIEKINLNFYFFLKRFYKGLKGFPS